MEITEVKSNNVKATFIKTKKFKTITIQVVFLGEFSKELATKRSLLTKMLTSSTKKYKTKKEIANKLYDLYDASLTITTYPAYQTSVTVFSLDIVNQKNLSSSNLTKEALEFLKEVLFNPDVEKGAFSKKIYKEQKRILKDRIDNVYNNKTRYALRQMLKAMGPDEIISVSSLGDLKQLEKTSPSNLYKMYQNMIENENVSIFVVGDFENDILEDLKILGDFKDNPKPTNTVSQEEIKIEKVKEIVEKQNINQSKLIMGFRTSTNTVSELYLPSLIFNAMYGGTFASDLIRVVREENSLAYTIASQILSEIKILIVSAGIDKDKYQMTSDLVIKQLELYKQGKIDDANMGLSKQNIINQLSEIEDSPYMLTNFILRNYIHNIDLDVEQMISNINDITLEQIKQVAAGINLDTIFLLSSEGNNG